MPAPASAEATYMSLASPTSAYPANFNTPTPPGGQSPSGEIEPYPGTSLESGGAAEATNLPSVYPGLSDPGEELSGEYPAPEVTSLVPAYPVNTPLGSDFVYPGVGAQTPTVTATPGSASATSSLVPGQSFQTPTPTSSIPPQSFTATPQTVTSTPSPTSSLMPTPTLTPSPTIVPPPPWIQSKLVASDPDEVILASGKVQLIEFFAFWCGPCQAMAPLVRGLEERYTGQMNFIYLDIDDPDTASLKKLLGYKNQPHFFLLDPYGRIIQQWVGVFPIDELTRAIEASIK